MPVATVREKRFNTVSEKPTMPASVSISVKIPLRKPSEMMWLRRAVMRIAGAIRRFRSAKM